MWRNDGRKKVGKRQLARQYLLVQRILRLPNDSQASRSKANARQSKLYLQIETARGKVQRADMLSMGPCADCADIIGTGVSI
jgi:hypothetical protein